MAATYYNTDAQITDLLPDLTNSEIDTAAKRNTKLRMPARDWLNSVYPTLAPFPTVSAAGEEWLVNGAVTTSATQLAIDGGSNAPAAEDWFRFEYHNTFYRVSAYSAPTVTFAADPPDWDGALQADVDDNTRIIFGTPMLLQQAAAWFCVHLGYQILRRNPVDDASAAALHKARVLLQIPDGGNRAQAQPFPTTKWADDYRAYNDYQPGHATLIR